MKQPTRTMTTFATLKDEIKLVKSRIKNREIDLENRWQRLPEESVKATFSIVLPVFISNKIAGGTWQLFQSVLGLFFGSNKSSDAQSTLRDMLLGPAKKVGVFTLLKLVFRWLKK